MLICEELVAHNAVFVETTKRHGFQESLKQFFFFKVKSWIAPALLGQPGVFAKQMSLLELSLLH